MNNIIPIIFVIGLMCFIPTSSSNLPDYINSIGHPHNQDLNITSNVTFNNITSNGYFIGDGSLLTNLTGLSLPSYLTAIGHPHNQDVNTSSNVVFNQVTANNYVNLPYVNPFNQILNTTSNVNFNTVTANALFGDGGNITNVTASIPSWLYAYHPHNQDLNTTNNVTFSGVHIDDYNVTHNTTFGKYDEAYMQQYLLKSSGGLPILYSMIMICNNIDNYNIAVSKGSYDFKIDSSGIIDLPYQASARAILSGVQSVNGGVLTKMVLSTEEFDLNNDYDTTNYRFVVPVEGLYQVSYSVNVLNMPDQKFLWSCVFVNGNDYAGMEISYASGTSDLSNSGSDIIKLNADDYIELYVQHNAIGFKSFPANRWTNYLAICKIA